MGKKRLARLTIALQKILDCERAKGLRVDVFGGAAWDVIALDIMLDGSGCASYSFRSWCQSWYGPEKLTLVKSQPQACDELLSYVESAAALAPELAALAQYPVTYGGEQPKP